MGLYFEVHLNIDFKMPGNLLKSRKIIEFCQLKKVGELHPWLAAVV